MATVNFKMDVAQFDSLRAIIDRDEKHTEQLWKEADALTDKNKEMDTKKDLQRHQFQREHVRRALGLL